MKEAAAHHVNTRISPIPIRVFTPAIATPRKISAGMLSDRSFIRLRSTAFFHAGFPPPDYIKREPGNRSGQKYKSVLKGEGVP
jgi:hypothetical protein